MMNSGIRSFETIEKIFKVLSQIKIWRNVQTVTLLTRSTTPDLAMKKKQLRKIKTAVVFISILLF